MQWLGVAPPALAAVLIGTVLSAEVVLRLLPLKTYLVGSAADLFRVTSILRSASASDGSKQRAARVMACKSLAVGVKISLACVAVFVPFLLGIMIAAGDRWHAAELLSRFPLWVCVSATAASYVFLRKRRFG